MRFKKIYIEITNKCNLNCSFCIKDNRSIKEMSLEEFEEVLQKINNYTDYIYLHVKGEPLLHSNFKEILSLCKKYNKKVNITTNGVFLKNRVEDINKFNVVRQINISLHSENDKENYIEDIISSVKKLKNIYIVYRFWTLDNNKIDEKMLKYLNKIKEEYKIDNNTYKKILTEDNIRIDDNIYINKDKKFTWPSLDNYYYEEKGYCYGLKRHIGILVDGRVIICCLDSFGSSDLGNIFNSSLEEILNTDKCKNIIEGFNNRKAYLNICKHCSFKEKFNK